MLKAGKEKRVQREKLVQRVHRERLAQLVHKVPQESKAQRVFVVFQALLVNKDFQVHRDKMAPLDLWVHLASLA